MGAEDTGISFVSKTITNESFADSVSETSAGIVRIIFMGLLPWRALPQEFISLSGERMRNE